MKITISKSQWKEIGDKTGWMGNLRDLRKMREMGLGKKAEIVDVSRQNGLFKPVFCENCRRWATVNPDGSIEWKHYPNMTIEEKSQVDQLSKLFNDGLVKFETVICSLCSGEEDWLKVEKENEGEITASKRSLQEN